jgi:hypothetical protein
MGATGWTYFTPYHPDPAVALGRLRQEVFARGDHRNPGDFRRWMRLFAATTPEMRENPIIHRLARIEDALETGSEEGLTEQERGELQLMRRLHERDAMYGVLAGAPPFLPTTIEELLERAAADGTHSILDITHVAEHPEFAAASPLDEELLDEGFGTQRPTREQVTPDFLMRLGGALERWQAFYFALYRDGRPSEYVFVGCSGD